MLPPSSDPAARCAATLADRLDLNPPIDIDAVAARYCDVEFLTWPYACDALAVGLASLRPSVFIRRNNQGARRRRFTLAHELGHVVLPWHVGLTACVPVTTSFDADPLGPAPVSKLLTQTRIAEQEAEATRFAGALLVPRRFIESHADTGGIGEAIRSLNRTNISAIAGILSLSQNLLPGFCFIIDEDEEGLRTVTSSGTSIPPSDDRRPLEARLRDKARDFGEAHVSGRRVLWYQLAVQTEFVLPEDARSTTQILRDSVAGTTPPTEVPVLLMRINGIVGGILSKEERAQNEAQALSILEYRFGSDPELNHLLQQEDFCLYLCRKASERIAHRRGNSLNLSAVV